jgi:MATE family multidrug resistance protein
VVTHRGVLAIALPMTLAYLTTPLVGAVSLAVVGQLGDPALVGGVSIGGLIFDIAFSTFNFLRSGTTGLAAQALGAGYREELMAIFWRALLMAVAIGVVILLLQAPILRLALSLIGGSAAVQAATQNYWQIRVLAAPMSLANYAILGWLIGLGRAGYGLVLQLVLNGVNITISVVLVHLLHFGVAGVGWASVAAESAAALIGLSLVMRLGRREPVPTLARIAEGNALRRMVAVNRDIMIRSFALLFAFAFFTAQSARAGDIVLAANEILFNLTIVAAYLLDGLAAAAEQLAGRAIGARHRPAFDRAMRLAIGWGYGVAAAASLFLWLAGPLLIDLMTTSPGVRDAARDFLPLAALVPLVGTLAYQMDGIFIGATWSTDMRNMMLLSLVAYLAMWRLLAEPLGVAGLWLALLTFIGLRGLTLLWRSRTRIGLAFP